MSRNPYALEWVVFFRATRHRKWLPTSAHETRAKADTAYWDQINKGPPGDHLMRRLEPVTPKAMIGGATTTKKRRPKA